ncbi:MAG: glycosyltransferase family 2 protein [Faecousia sp.]
MPKVSVVMPAYNAEKYIGEAIDSILNQTFTDFEFVIINDGSTDRTKEIILSYSDPRIVYLENDTNSGIVVTLNKGLDYATGEYIARMDADDISVNTRFQKQVDYLDIHPNIGVLGTGLKKFGDGITESNRIFSANPYQLKAELVFSSCIAHPTVMMRRLVLEENQIRYQEEFAGAEDYLLWWQLAQKTNISALTDILHLYRIHNTQITQDKGEKYKVLLKRLLEVRFADMQFHANDEQKSIFLKYCIGECGKYTANELALFIDVLASILDNNRDTQFFMQDKLRTELAYSVLNCMNHAPLIAEEKKQAYKLAVNNNLFSYAMRLKILYQKVIRR